MRIVIDMQGAQSTGSRHRGIGRYTLALTKEMARHRGEHVVILALNGLFSDTIEPIRAAFNSILPQDNICVWEAEGPVGAINRASDTRRQSTEIAREAFLISLQPDIVLITSLFEGLGDDAVTSIGVFTTSLHTAVVLYDLIPLIHRSIYLENPVVERWYLNKIDQLRRSNLLLSISASSGTEGVDYLGFPSAKVANISTACDEQFQPQTITNTQRAYLLKSYRLRSPFVMYTGGIDHRKNIEGLIRAYSCLPRKVREDHQLAVVCSIQTADRERLQQLAKTHGLGSDELVLTGFVTEVDLVALYNACKMFIFPSWHEGFGLPALEAMACGKAVIGANRSSIPEVIGRQDALFDPFDDKSITAKMLQVLTDDEFRLALEQHGKLQAKKFSWPESASRAWTALESFVSTQKRPSPVVNTESRPRRPRLAYFSPLPPEPSGISDYSAELLPELARHYEIEVIVPQKVVSDAWVTSNCPVRDVAWFRQNAHSFERIMYHLGNSDFHTHMFDLLDEYPGVVVLHDFFLSGIVAHMDATGEKPHAWARALVRAHGWAALRSRFTTKDTAEVMYAYPCNMNVLAQSLGVIVHSEQSRRLAADWYDANAAKNWTVIPLSRAPAGTTNRYSARQTLGLKEKDFVVCTFGHLGPTKLNHKLFSAWLATPMAADPHCHLIFVGQNHGGEYGNELVRVIRGSGVASRVEITGWTDSSVYKTWLAAADVGVQLRTLSRGETSAAVLDCMNHGLATIVNANGSMADLPPDSVWLLRDDFANDELTKTLTTLWQDVGRRKNLGINACEVIRTHHQPRRCAEQYAEAIEGYYRQASIGPTTLFDALARMEGSSDRDNTFLATILAKNFPARLRRKQLLLDISELVRGDSKSGIQRVIRALLLQFLLNPPKGWTVEPVFSTVDAEGYCYARSFTSRFLNIDDSWAEDEPVEVWPGDVFLGLDLQPVIVPAQKDYLLGWHRRGIKIFFVVYDLLPLLHPDFFQDMAKPIYQCWLETINQFDGALCISRTVADQLHEWLQVFGKGRERPFALDWFHLGADIENTIPTMGMPDNAMEVFSALNSRPTFLMIGTLEPRKGHAQTLAAFEQIWQRGDDVNLVIVGKQGWVVEALVKKLLNHHELGKRLFWLEGISDEYLEKVFEASSCLIAASEGEGFGLPLIEAARHRLPIIARDISAFREVAGVNAYYFVDERDPDVLASALQKWLSLYRVELHTRSDAIPWLTWEASAHQLRGAIMDETVHYRTWLPDGIHRYWGGDPRFHTQVGERSGQAMCTTGKAGLLIFGPYAPFDARQYRLIMKGEVHGSIAGCWMDVTYDSGSQRLMHTVLPEPDANGQWTIACDFALDVAVKDLELRVWVHESANLTLASVVITPTLPNMGPIQSKPDVEGALTLSHTEVDQKYLYKGNDERLSTRIGERTAIGMTTTRKAGCLLFGPQICLPNGLYRVVITGALGKNGAAKSSVSVTIDKGTTILAELFFSEPDVNGVLASMAVSLDNACTDFEVRVWVSDHTDLRISMLEIIHLQNEKQKGHIVSIENTLANTDDQTTRVISKGRKLIAEPVSVYDIVSKEGTNTPLSGEASTKPIVASGLPLLRPPTNTNATQLSSPDTLLQGKIILPQYPQTLDNLAIPVVPVGTAITIEVSKRLPGSNSERNRSKADRRKKR